MNSIIEQNLGEITRWVSKSGSFVYGREILSCVAPELSNGEIVEIYNFVKENSERMETEWRPDFITLFPGSDAFLPKVDPAEYWGDRLHAIVESGSLPLLDAFIVELDAEGWCLPGSDFDIYPFEAGDGNGESPINKAFRFGHSEIAKRLEQLIRKIKIG